MARLHTFVSGGWLYEGKYFDDDCITEVLIEEGRLAPAARDIRPDESIPALIDTEALTTAERIDSDVIPQEVPLATGVLVGEVCHRCLAHLDPDTTMQAGRESVAAAFTAAVEDWIDPAHDEVPERPNLRIIEGGGE